MITNYKYNDIILYAKGWYAKNDVIDDLAYLFAQIYGWNPVWIAKSKNGAESDIARFMLMVLDDLKENNIHIRYTCDKFALLIDEIKCKQTMYNITFDMATIFVVLSVLLEISSKDIKLNPPHFGKKEYFRLGRLGKEYPKSMTYTSMNKIAQKAFNN